MSTSLKNLWTAAGDGDLERVRQLLDNGQSPNEKDDNAYTALHAASSWSSPEVLRLLVERGGDVNITDDDGETPLFVVESVNLARLLIELGANPRHTSAEGLTPAAHLAEDQPAVSSYLCTITGESLDLPDAADQSIDSTADQGATQMLQRAQEIITQANADGTEPDAALHDLIQQTLTQASQTGQAMTSEINGHGGASVDGELPRKRQR